MYVIQSGSRTEEYWDGIGWTISQADAKRINLKGATINAWTLLLDRIFDDARFVNLTPTEEALDED